MLGFKGPTMNTSRPREFPAEASEIVSEPKVYTVELTPAMIVAASIALVVVLAWVFVFGIIIGRGYVPAKGEKTASVVVVPTLRTAERSATDKGVIKPEDLDFMKELKSSGDVVEPLPEASGQESGTRPAARDEAPESSSVQAKAVKPAVAYVPDFPKSMAGVERPTPKTDGDRTVRTEGKIFPVAGTGPHATSATYPSVVRNVELRDYVYQVASYTGPGAAGKQCGKLEAGGVNVRVSVEKDDQGVTRYRLQAFIRGTESDASALRANLARLGFKSPLLISKKVVPGR